MVAFLQTTFWLKFSYNEHLYILIEVTLEFVSKDRINNNPALFQTMACRLFGDKPLSEPKMVWCTDAFNHHLAEVINKELITYRFKEHAASSFFLNSSSNAAQICYNPLISGSCCLPLGALQSMWVTWCKNIVAESIYLLIKYSCLNFSS